MEAHFGKTPSELFKEANSYTVGSYSIEDFATRSYTYYDSYYVTGTNQTTAWGTENLESLYGGAARAEKDYVKTVTHKGGCGGCGGGGAGQGMKRTYYYMGVANAVSSPGLNDATWIVVEDTEDGASSPQAVYRTVWSLNPKGQVLRRILIEDPTLSAPVAWCHSTLIGTSTSGSSKSYARVTERRMPSNHVDVDTNSEITKFLNPTRTGYTYDADTSAASTGLAYTFSYNGEGYQTGHLVKKGRTGTAKYLSATEWGNGTTNGKHLPLKTYAFFAETSNLASGIETTYSYTYWGSGVEVPKVITTTYPDIDTSQNGAGTSNPTVTKAYLDELGRVRWLLDGEEYTHYRSYDPETGGVSYAVADVTTSSVSTIIDDGVTGEIEPWDDEGSDVPSGFDRGTGLPDSALDLVTRVRFDNLGRAEKVTNRGKVHFTVHEDGRVLSFPYWDLTSNEEPLLPIVVQELDDAGRTTESYEILASRSNVPSGETEPEGLSASTTQAHYLSWSINNYDKITGELDSSDRYFEIPSTGLGTLNSNFHREAFLYDDQGRLEYEIRIGSGSSASNGVEEISQTIYDVLDRPVEHKQRVSDPVLFTL